MHDAPATVLVVEDDDATRAFLADNLCADGYELLVASTVREAKVLLETRFPDLVVCDVGLPDASGLDLVRMVREGDGLTARVDPRTPILVLSGRCSELDRVRGFERGADDVVGKPFGYAELRARVAALLRRAAARPRTARVKVGPVEVDPLTRQVLLHGEAVKLSAKELALLRILVSDPTRVWTKEELLRSIWGVSTASGTRTLDTHACRLRQKLRARGDDLVVNVWGVGYRLVDPAPTALAA